MEVKVWVIMEEKNRVQWFQQQTVSFSICAPLYSAIARAKASSESSAARAQVGLVSVS